MNQISELLYNTFLFLTHKDLNNVSSCSKFFNAIVNDIHQGEKGIGLLNKWRYWHFFVKSFVYQNSSVVKADKPLLSNHVLPFLSYFSDVEGLYFKVYPKFIQIETFGHHVLTLPLSLKIKKMKRIHHLPSLTFLVIHGKSNTYVFNYRTLSVRQYKRSCYSYNLCTECKSFLKTNVENCSELEMWSLMHKSLRFQPNCDMSRYRIITSGSNSKHQIVKNNRVTMKVDLCSLTKEYVILGTRYLMVISFERGGKKILIDVESKTEIEVKCKFVNTSSYPFETLKVCNPFTHFGYIFDDWWGFYQRGRDQFVAQRLKVDKNNFLPVRCPYEKRYILTNFNYNSSLTHRRLKTRENGRISYGTHTHHNAGTHTHHNTD